MKKKYTIKEIAELLNISKDTLRFYERKGIISPIKGENGYRYYTSDHVWTLLDIIFYRRINFSINEIDSIVNHSTIESIIKMTQEKIIEEARQVRFHQQALLKLQLANESYQRIENHLHSYSIQPLSKHFIIGHRYVDKEGSVEGLFQSMGERMDSEFCYTYNKYLLDTENTGEPRTPRLCELYLTIAADTVHLLDMSEDFISPYALSFPACVYTIVESDCRNPKAQSILEAAHWALSHGFQLQNAAYSDYLLSCCENGVTTYYLELYLPLDATAETNGNHRLTLD